MPQKVTCFACNFPTFRPVLGAVKKIHEKEPSHDDRRKRVRPATSGVLLLPNLSPQEPACGPSPAHRRPPGFRRVEVVGSAAEALPGASAVFLNSRALGEHLESVVNQCLRHRVTKLVALSAINADDDFSRQPSRFRGDRNKEVEQLAVESGLAWVSLRPTVFATNFAGMWSPQIRGGDVVAGPYAAASSAPIVESDISAVAARALLTDELLGSVFR